MQSAWRVVDCSGLEGEVSYVRGNLRVHRKTDGVTQNVPLEQLAVLLLGLKAKCSGGLLHQLAEFGVSVMVCDWRQVPVAAFHSWSKTYTNITARQTAQVAQSKLRKKNLWARIVRAKVRDQAACLEGLGRENFRVLSELAKTVRSGDPSNVEGQAARLYWQSLFGRDFRRNPGAREFGRNSQLDYAYMVLRGFAVKSVVSAGLAPMFGVNHHNRGNYFCLVDDLIEPFRPAVDFGVAQLDEFASVDDPQVRAGLVEAVNAQFWPGGFTIPVELDRFSQQVGMYFEGKVDGLRVPVFGCADEGS